MIGDNEVFYVYRVHSNDRQNLLGRIELIQLNEVSIFMKQVTKLLCGAAVTAFMLSASACGKSEEKSDGSAEKTGATVGKAIDQATEKAGAAMEKTGEAVKEAGKKVKEGASEAMDKMKKSKK